MSSLAPLAPTLPSPASGRVQARVREGGEGRGEGHCGDRGAPAGGQWACPSPVVALRAATDLSPQVGRGYWQLASAGITYADFDNEVLIERNFSARQVIFAQLVVDAARRQPEKARGLRLVVVHLLHRRFDDLAFAMGEARVELPSVLPSDPHELVVAPLPGLIGHGRSCRHSFGATQILPQSWSQVAEANRAVSHFCRRRGDDEIPQLPGIAVQR